jgi:hypothetical protein
MALNTVSKARLALTPLRATSVGKATMGQEFSTSSLVHTGWKAGKHPAAGEVFFLTFPFIELLGTWSA